MPYSHISCGSNCGRPAEYVTQKGGQPLCRLHAADAAPFTLIDPIEAIYHPSCSHEEAA